MTWKDILFVGLQLILLLGYVFIPNAFPFPTAQAVNLLALFFFIAGILIVVFALLQLNKNLSPFPTPKSSSVLITHGLYKFIRHPIYTGIIIFVFGYAVYSHHPMRIMVGILLFILFYLKSKYEERLLKRKFNSYERYQSNTGRFFPFIWFFYPSKNGWVT